MHDPNRQIHPLIILGAGIAGLGVALEATKKGLTPLIIDSKSPCHATSDNSLRIIHGGFRYLQSFNVPRLIRSLNDQTAIAKRFNSSIKPLPCLMPLSRFGLKSRIPVSLAAYFYGLAMRFCRSPLPPPNVLSKNKIKEIAPIISAKAPYGALCWNDLVMLKPQEISELLVQHLLNNGAKFLNNTSVVGIDCERASSNPISVILSSGEELLANRVVNTLGPWLGTISLPKHLLESTLKPKWCIGFNLIISKQIHSSHAIAVQGPDGRLFFCVPRAGGSAIGTWYTPLRDDLGCSEVLLKDPPTDEIERFVAAWCAALPEGAFKLEDIESIDSGVLPMIHDSEKGPLLYGSEVINVSNDRRYLEVLSTKYTTFLSQGQRVLQLLLGAP
jgi:glycerol-3-phosphate dehydrogenase